MKTIFFILIFLCYFVTSKSQSNGYALNASVFYTASNPSDGITYYGGYLVAGTINTEGELNIFLRKSGTIGIAEFRWSANGTAGSNESISLYLRLNNTTDYLVATISDTNAIKEFSNTSINIPFISGDYIELKLVCPTWTTNPTSVLLGGYIFINPTP